MSTRVPDGNSAADDRVDVRVLTYNVRALRDDDAALMRVIRACRPDVVCVQEAPRFIRWRTKCSELARRAGLTVVRGGAEASGNLLLSALRVSVERTGIVVLPYSRWQHRRAVALAVLRVGAARFVLGGTHLSLDAEERQTQMRALHAAAHGLGVEQVVIGGDMNEHPSDPAWSWLAERMTDTWTRAPRGGEFTSGARDPYQRIDGVFCSPTIEVVRAGVPLDLVDEHDLEVATDHRPVLADLRLRAFH